MTKKDDERVAWRIWELISAGSTILAICLIIGALIALPTTDGNSARASIWASVFVVNFVGILTSSILAARPKSPTKSKYIFYLVVHGYIVWLVGATLITGLW